MTHKHWTPSELSYIKEKYPIVETKSLAKRLGVTPYQIQAVAQKHGLKKRFVKRSSANAEQHPYLKLSFWEKNAFWRTGMYSKKEQARLDAWLEKMRVSERSLTRL